MIITASPMVVRDGTVIGASAVVHDVTARRRVESELERSTPSCAASPTSPHTTSASRWRRSRASPRCCGADDETSSARAGSEALGYIEMSVERARRLVDGLREYAQAGRGELVRREVDSASCVARAAADARRRRSTARTPA